MKRVLIMVFVVLLFASTVMASNKNGDYNGKPIIIMKSEGKELLVDDAPAVLMDDRTMVPIYMLRQIGLEVEWNAGEYSVDVKMPMTSTIEQSNDIVDVPKLTKDMLPYNVEFVEYTSNG